MCLHFLEARGNLSSHLLLQNLENWENLEEGKGVEAPSAAATDFARIKLHRIANENKRTEPEPGFTWDNGAVPDKRGDRRRHQYLCK